ncbi:tetratricopeptide (TPR) repeat protein [Haloferula luteola]|uniref:Tetratricopeptide (TPR) repeat protein n=1 Tax=Haloferula luteola TaxID=595692 RepID=A0A840V8A4_9BACT|nr:tetratricopeptide repeat protein [Haloferula luteola]MBB5353953.1 tetratricopeptide (TPR) repeat protein [Haloferula luteola]
MKLPLVALILASAVMAAEPSKDDFKKALEEDPNDRSALYNFGMASYMDEDYAQAIDSWQRLEKLEPADWQLKAKLIQAYWAAGQHDKAEATIGELRAARSAGKSDELKKQTFFIRDQFVVGEFRVFTLEYFDLAGERPLLWKFILRSGDKAASRYFSLGSYDSTNEFMRTNGDLKPDERAFHLDGYSSNGDHQTFSFFRERPKYEAVRSQVIEILHGKRSEISSTRATNEGERDRRKTPVEPVVPLPSDGAE